MNRHGPTNFIDDEHAKLGSILTAIQSAQAPPKFNRTFLENLGFTSSGDRLVINVLKAVGLLAADGTPTDRYFRFLDQTQAEHLLAEGIREAYGDLFQLNRDAQTMTKAELKGKIKTLTQGKVSDNVGDKMAITFQGLVKHADFKRPVVAGDDASERPVDSLSLSRNDDGDDFLDALEERQQPGAVLVQTVNPTWSAEALYVAVEYIREKGAAVTLAIQDWGEGPEAALGALRTNAVKP